MNGTLPIVQVFLVSIESQNSFSSPPLPLIATTSSVLRGPPAILAVEDRLARRWPIGNVASIRQQCSSLYQLVLNSLKLKSQRRLQ
jgi:hypothetical protein